MKALGAVGLPLLGSVSPARPSLPMDAGRRNASEKLCGRCGPELRAPLFFCSWKRTVSEDSAEGLGPGSTGHGNSASGTDVLRSGYQRDESPASAAKQSTEACDWINHYGKVCDWLWRTHPGTWPPVCRAHVHQVVEVGGW